MSDQSLLVRGNGAERGLTLDLRPEDAGWEYIGFSMLRLPAGDAWEGDTGEREVALVNIGGVAQVTAGGQTWEVGGRATPFDGPPHCLYLPDGSDWKAVAETDCVFAVCSAPGKGAFLLFETATLVTANPRIL